MEKNNAQASGNVIWIILIAVSLFALLTYAVTKGGRQEQSSLTKEQAGLVAAEIVQHASDIKIAVNRIMLYSGGDDTVISFAHPSANATYGTYGTTPKNEIFNPAGGNAVWQSPPSGANDGSAYEFMGRLKITGVGSGAAAAGAELTVNLFALTASVCEEINKTLGHTWTSIPVNAGTITTTRFAGTYTDGDTVVGTSSELTGKFSFCFREGAGGQRYIFTYVLRAR